MYALLWCCEGRSAQAISTPSFPEMKGCKSTMRKFKSCNHNAWSYYYKSRSTCHLTMVTYKLTTNSMKECWNYPHLHVGHYHKCNRSLLLAEPANTMTNSMMSIKSLITINKEYWILDVYRNLRDTGPQCCNSIEDKVISSLWCAGHIDDKIQGILIKLTLSNYYLHRITLFKVCNKPVSQWTNPQWRPNACRSA